jgi:hypothetical protein
MKSLIAIVAVLTSLTASAGWVQTINGKLSGVSKFTCTLTNNTGRDLDVKRVSFKLERRAGRGDSRDVTRTQIVNNVIYSGETSSVTLSGANGSFIGHSCQFVVRN